MAPAMLETVDRVRLLMVALLQARKVVLEVGPKGSRFLIPGGGKLKPPDINLADFPHHLTAKKRYRLTFDVNPLVNLLLILRHVPRPCIHVSGPRSPVLFTTGDGFRYLLFPREARRTL